LGAFKSGGGDVRVHRRIRPQAATSGLLGHGATDEAIEAQAGQLLPWTRAPYGFRLDPDRPRSVAGLSRESFEAVVVERIFASYIEQGATLYSVAKQLSEERIATPSGKCRWNVATVRGILRNPAYAGTAQAGRTSSVPARTRKSALQPVGLTA
jgi:site-specific DNA recombinase